MRDLPEPVNDPDEVRRIAEDILADPRYVEPTETLPEAFQRWVGERIDDLLSALAGGGGGTLIAWLFVLAAVGLIVVLVVRFAGGVRLDRPVTAEAAPAMVELTRSPEEWRAEAASLALEGRFREAMRCRHRALVADLVARGVIPEIPGRTAREYVADVAVELPPAGPSMAGATDLFEAAWYGDAPVGRPDLDRFESLERDVLGPRRTGVLR